MCDNIMCSVLYTLLVFSPVSASVLIPSNHRSKEVTLSSAGGLSPKVLIPHPVPFITVPLTLSVLSLSTAPFPLGFDLQSRRHVSFYLIVQRSFWKPSLFCPWKATIMGQNLQFTAQITWHAVLLCLESFLDPLLPTRLPTPSCKWGTEEHIDFVRFPSVSLHFDKLHL